MYLKERVVGILDFFGIGEKTKEITDKAVDTVTEQALKPLEPVIEASKGPGDSIRAFQQKPTIENYKEIIAYYDRAYNGDANKKKFQLLLDHLKGDTEKEKKENFQKLFTEVRTKDGYYLTISTSAAKEYLNFSNKKLRFAVKCINAALQESYVPSGNVSEQSATDKAVNLGAAAMRNITRDNDDNDDEQMPQQKKVERESR